MRFFVRLEGKLYELDSMALFGYQTPITALRKGDKLLQSQKLLSRCDIVTFPLSCKTVTNASRTGQNRQQDFF